jgi:hypothetical protein
LGSKKSSPTTCQPVYVVDPETASIMSIDSSLGAMLWDDERGITALRKYYALKDEAQDTVTESKHQKVQVVTAQTAAWKGSERPRE